MRSVLATLILAVLSFSGICSSAEPYPVTIARNGAKVYARKPASHPASDSAAKPVALLKKGVKVTKQVIFGSWYQVALDDGVAGWVYQTDIVPNPVAEAVALHSAPLLADTADYKPGVFDRKAGIQGMNVRVLAYSGRFTKIKIAREDYPKHPKAGRSGWVRSFVVRMRDEIPGTAHDVVSYRLFHAVDTFFQRHWSLSLLGFFVWLGVLSIPGIAGVLLGYQGIGRIRFLPNIVVFVLTFLAITTSWGKVQPYLGGVPPFMDRPARYMFGLLAMIALWVYIGFRLIEAKRCPRCHRVGAGKGDGSELVDKQTYNVDTINTSTGGLVKRRRKTVFTYDRRRKCRFCGHVWKIREIVSS